LLLVVVAGVGGLIALSAQPAARPNATEAPAEVAEPAEAVAAPLVTTNEPEAIPEPTDEATEPTEPTEPSEPANVETRPHAQSGEATAPGGPEDEIRHLAELRTLSQSDPGRAVREANRGDARFEGGLFAEERAAIRVFALERAGRHAAAVRAGRRFLARYPDSPQRPQIQELLR
jgi:hypothetical protein